MLVKRKDLAEHMGVTEKTVYKYEDEGIITRAIDEPGVVRFDLEECLAAFRKRAEAKRKPRMLLSLATRGRASICPIAPVERLSTTPPSDTCPPPLSLEEVE